MTPDFPAPDPAAPELATPELDALVELCQAAQATDAAPVVREAFDNALTEALTNRRIGEEDRALVGALAGELATMVAQDPASQVALERALALMARAVGFVLHAANAETRAPLLMNAAELTARAHLRGLAVDIDLAFAHFAAAASAAAEFGGFELSAEAGIRAAELRMHLAAGGSRAQRAHAALDAIAHSEDALGWALRAGDDALRFEAWCVNAAAWSERIEVHDRAAEMALRAIGEAAGIARGHGGAHDLARVDHDMAALRLLTAGAGDKEAVESAIADLERALAVRRPGAPDREAESLLALGTAYARREHGERAGNLAAAARHLEDAVLTYEALGESSPETSALLALPHARALTHLANVLSELEGSDASRIDTLFVCAAALSPASAHVERALMCVNRYDAWFRLQTPLRAGVNPEIAAEELDAAADILGDQGDAADAAKAARLADRCRAIASQT